MFNQWNDYSFSSYMRSNLPDDAVWYSVFGERAEDQCPVCLTSTITLIKKNWRKAFYIPINQGGSDTFPNVTPICVNCDNSLKGKNIYQYQNSLGMMTLQEKTELENKKQEELKTFIPTCSYHLGQGKYCNQRKAHLYTDKCKQHYHENIEPMDTTEDNIGPCFRSFNFTKK